MNYSQPFTLPNGVRIKNRLVKSAMSEALGTGDNHPTALLERLYSRWALGGIGLSITGNVMVDGRALGEPNNVVVQDESDLDCLRRWAQAGTASGTQLWMQLNHPGRQAPKGLNRENVAPSAVPFRSHMARFFPMPRAMTEEEIRDVISRFAKTAAIAKKAGFTGVQIHGAHGYLVSQFLSPRTNQRTDAWGGTPENRRRFMVEILGSIRTQVGADFPIGIKLNSADFQKGGFTEEESLDAIRALAAGGIDMIEISGGTYEAPAMTGPKTIKESTKKREAYFLEFAEKARLASPVPLLLTGGFRTPQGMDQAIGSGAVDFIGLARSLAVEPDLPSRLLKGLDPLYPLTPRTTGIQWIDRLGFLEIAWYSRQLGRMGRGLDPNPNCSPLAAFFANVFQRGWRFLRVRS
jgi:2,4-dienoyl-CoA reductase-like NADH-dependent reductase (Old Yellow Enzyme family)